MGKYAEMAAKYRPHQSIPNFYQYRDGNWTFSTGRDGIEQLRRLDHLYDTELGQVLADMPLGSCDYGVAFSEHGCDLNTYCFDADMAYWGLEDTVWQLSAWHGEHYCIPATWTRGTGWELEQLAAVPLR